jgi:hypothetical protein
MLTKKNIAYALFGVMSPLHQLLNFIKAFGALKFTVKYGAESIEICHSGFRYHSIIDTQAVQNNKLSNIFTHDRIKEELKWKDLRHEALTAVKVKIIIFWDVTPCSLVHIYEVFGGTCRIYLQSRIKS